MVTLATLRPLDPPNGDEIGLYGKCAGFSAFWTERWAEAPNPSVVD
jgi:hypothetical protein